jgi:hypothetical protein
MGRSEKVQVKKRGVWTLINNSLGCYIGRDDPPEGVWYSEDWLTGVIEVAEATSWADYIQFNIVSDAEYEELRRDEDDLGEFVIYSKVTAN